MGLGLQDADDDQAFGAVVGGREGAKSLRIVRPVIVPLRMKEDRTSTDLAAAVLRAGLAQL